MLETARGKQEDIKVLEEEPEKQISISQISHFKFTFTFILPYLCYHMQSRLILENVNKLDLKRKLYTITTKNYIICYKQKQTFKIKATGTH